MNLKPSNEELVSRYLEQGMPDEERLAFEQQLKADPELSEEFDLQSSIVDAIRDRRRMELKARLDQISIQPPLFQTITAKIATIAGVTAIVGAGAYYLLSSSEKSIPMEVALSPQEAVEFNLPEVPPTPEAITPQTGSTKEESRPAKVRPRTERRDNGTLARKESEEPKQLRPNVVQPEIGQPPRDVDQELAEVPEVSGMNGVEQFGESTESKVTVEVIKDRKNRFHYQFYNGKLYLLGDFSEMPYEIIEFNSQSGRKFFLFYNGSYYRLNQGVEKPAPLVRLDDPALIRELSIIQENK
jgi:hypothetical protein